MSVELDEDGLTLEQLIEVRRGLRDDKQRELDRHPDQAELIEERYKADDETLAASIEDALDDLRYLERWSSELADNPLAAELAHTFLEQSHKGEEAMLQFFREVASRWQEATAPQVEPEPELGDLVAEVDANNPAPRAVGLSGRRNEAPTERIGTHESPLGPIRPYREPQTVRETFPKREDISLRRTTPMRVVLSGDDLVGGTDDE